MKKWLLIFIILCPVAAHATAYTATCAHETMHIGDIVPPGVYNVVANSAPTVPVGAGSAIFATAPALCTQSATSGSGVGSYTSTMNTGTLANPGTDTITYVNGTTVVIASDGIGAVITDSIAYPPGFTGAAAYAAINATSNNICTMVGDGVTDNTDCFNYLEAFSRGAQSSVGTCSGTTLTWVSGTNYSGMTISSDNSAIYIGGVVNQVSSVTDSTHLQTVNACTGSGNQVVRLPRMHVSATNGSTTVTWVEGPQFTSAAFPANTNLLIGNCNCFYNVASVTDATHIVLKSAYTGITGADIPFYNAQRYDISGSGDLPLYIFVPAGNYLTSNTINLWGNYESLLGVGPSTHFILAANSSAFNTGTNIVWLQMATITGADGFDVQWHNWSAEVRPGNPNAEAMSYVVNNMGSIRNVLAYQDDSKCPEILNLARNETGPLMVKNFAGYGCANVILSGGPTYNVTMESITAEAATTTGIVNNQMKTQARHVLFDEASVPCMTVTAAAASAVLMNSECFGSGALAFQNSSTATGNTSTFYLKAVNVTGYTTSVADYGSGTLVTSTGNIVEQWTGTAISPFDSGLSAHSLGLPIQETPSASDPSASTWCVLGTDITTWNTTIAGCAATTVYAPPGQYSAGTSGGSVTLNIPDTINHLDFFNALPNPISTFTVTINEAGTSSTPFIMNTCILAKCTINHTGSRTLVLKDHNGAFYIPTTGAGNLFGDDVILGGGTGPTTFAGGQSIWVRQLDQEQNPSVKLVCNGTILLWILGYKTEHNGDNLDLSNNCQTEVYGFSALGDPPSSGTGGTMYTDTNSSLFATGSAVNQGGNFPGFQYWMTETRAGSTVSLTIPGAENVSEALGMMYSYGAATPPPAISVQINARIQGAKVQ